MQSINANPDSKVHGVNMGHTWFMSALGGPHVGPMNFAIWEIPLHYTKRTDQLSYRNLNLKVDHQTDGKLFIYGPKHHQENQFLSLEHSCWLSLIEYM